MRLIFRVSWRKALYSFIISPKLAICCNTGHPSESHLTRRVMVPWSRSYDDYRGSKLIKGKSIYTSLLSFECPN